nr:transposase [Pediococcus damnosus]
MASWAISHHASYSQVAAKFGYVERSFSWIEKCRRLWKNCERQLHTSATMMTLAFMSVLLRRF